jgi:Fibronectin type III domain
MEHAATSGNFGPGTAGMTLQQAVFAGLVDPGNLVNVREIVKLATPPADCGTAAPLNCDTSVYSGPRSQYTITTNAAGVTTVTDTTTVTPAVAGVVAKGDGTDTLFNIEQLQFSDGTIPVPAATGGGATTVPGAPAAPTAVAGNGTAQVTFAPPLNTGGGALTSFTIQVNAGATVVQTIAGIDPAATTFPVTGLTNGTAYTFQVLAVNAKGPGPLSAASSPVTPLAPVVPTAPGAPTIGTATAGNATATARWTAPANGGSPITSYTLQVRTGAVVVRTVTGIAPGAISNVVNTLTNGTAYNFRVRALNAIGTGPLSAASNVVTPATVPAAPVIGTATAGTAGGVINAIARWTPAANTGGAPITGFRVTALRLNAAGTVLATTNSAVLAATARTLTMTLPVVGNYRFTVQSINRVGTSAPSARSNLVAGR